MKVIFYEVHSPSEKVKNIEKICRDHIEKKKPLYFVIDDPKVMAYVDDLLWNLSAESFIPHKVHTEPGKGIILIGNRNHAPTTYNHFFNLSSRSFVECTLDSTIYEFDDQTIPEKKQITQKKYHQYKEKQAKIEVH